MLPPREARVLVAMSGGVDSAVAASLLVEQGCECIGLTLRLVPDHPERSVFEPCCGLEASQDARRVCEKLGIPHEVMYAVDRFDRDIISYFTEEYLAGRTPNPCVRCNRMVKFGALYRRADELGAQYIAMGHYARLEHRGPRLALRRGVFRQKDQSYVLAPLTQAQLRRAVFPLGGMRKDEVREQARRFDFRSAEKPDSQELCFVPDRNYARFLEGRTGTLKPGPILSTSGALLGQHKGLARHTIGQRRGLGIASDRPLYVVDLDPVRNALIVGYDEETHCAQFETGRICWGGLPPQDTPFTCRVQIRSRHTAVPATVTPQFTPGSKTGASVTLHEPQKAVTPGQWAVFYDDDDYVLASAPILRFQRA